jgi:uncharacterized protein YegJ (DUF2314 family)
LKRAFNQGRELVRESDFTDQMPGAFVKNLGGFTTFCPAPLPPVVPLTMSLARQPSEVDTMLGRLDGTAKALPDRKILVRSFVRREAQLSSYIENTCARYEAITRGPEFLTAFENGRPGQGFAVKKMFDLAGKIEQMWVEVLSIDGDRIRGALANDPQLVKGLKLREPVELEFDQIEDWICSIGRNHVGGIRAKAVGAKAVGAKAVGAKAVAAKAVAAKAVRAQQEAGNRD